MEKLFLLLEENIINNLIMSFQIFSQSFTDKSIGLYMSFIIDIILYALFCKLPISLTNMP